jgi:hypothetical protein
VDDESRRILRDPATLELLLLRGASTIPQAEAAERLVVKVPQLRDWLISNQFIELHHGKKPYARTHFKEATDRASDILRNGYSALEDSGLSMSCWSVLEVAANLSGEVVGTLRDVKDLENEHAKLVGEAVLYAFGFFDATVDVDGGWGEEMGPNAVEYNRRFGDY